MLQRQEEKKMKSYAHKSFQVEVSKQQFTIAIVRYQRLSIEKPTHCEIKKYQMAKTRARQQKWQQKTLAQMIY